MERIFEKIANMPTFIIIIFYYAIESVLVSVQENHFCEGERQGVCEIVLLFLYQEQVRCEQIWQSLKKSLKMHLKGSHYKKHEICGLLSHPETHSFHSQLWGHPQRVMEFHGRCIRQQRNKIEPWSFRKMKVGEGQAYHFWKLTSFPEHTRKAWGHLPFVLLTEKMLCFHPVRLSLHFSLVSG